MSTTPRSTSYGASRMGKHILRLALSNAQDKKKFLEQLTLLLQRGEKTACKIVLLGHSQFANVRKELGYQSFLPRETIPDIKQDIEISLAIKRDSNSREGCAKVYPDHRMRPLLEWVLPRLRKDKVKSFVHALQACFDEKTIAWLSSEMKIEL